MIYVDANVFVYATIGAKPYRSAAASALRRALSGGAATSALTLDEVLWALRKQGMPFAVAQARRILAMRDLRILPVGAVQVERALALVEGGLQPRDAIHAAVALAAQARFLTFDPDFDAVPGLVRVVP